MRKEILNKSDTFHLHPEFSIRLVSIKKKKISLSFQFTFPLEQKLEFANCKYRGGKDNLEHCFITVDPAVFIAESHGSRECHYRFAVFVERSRASPPPPKGRNETE